jgi:HSP20 family protein
MTHVKFARQPFEKSFTNFVDELFTDFPVSFNDRVMTWKGGAPVNIIETERNYLLEVIAPGFEKADFKINLDQNILSISAEKNNAITKDVDSNEKQIRKEYAYRSFKRSFTLDEKIDATSIDASYINGVLTLNLPKKELVKEAAKEIVIK